MANVCEIETLDGVGLRPRTCTEHKIAPLGHATLRVLQHVGVERDLKKLLRLGRTRELRVPRLARPGPARARLVDPDVEIGVADPGRTSEASVGDRRWGRSVNGPACIDELLRVGKRLDVS